MWWNKCSIWFVVFGIWDGGDDDDDDGGGDDDDDDGGVVMMIMQIQWKLVYRFSTKGNILGLETGRVLFRIKEQKIVQRRKYFCDMLWKWYYLQKEHTVQFLVTDLPSPACIKVSH